MVGRGGMATVYRVRHAQLGTVHALKVLHVPSPDVRQRLLQEGRAQGRLRHPKVVAVTDAVEVDGGLGLVMELVDGPSLERWLGGRGRPSLEEADAVARGILEGVLAAHRAGLVHRDLKPGNVLLEPVPGGFLPKVTDFGLVKVLAAEAAAEGDLATRTGVAMGTPAYMAPEQVRDASRVDARADVFSLGALLYELVTGRRAFGGEDMVATLDAVVGGRYAPPRTLVPDLPHRMEAAIEGALRRSREDRIADVVTLLETWTGAALPAAPSVADLGEREPTASTWNESSPATPRSASRRRFLVPFVGIAVLAALLYATHLAYRPEDGVPTAEGVPTVLADRQAQARIAEAWTALLRVDLERCSRLAGSAAPTGHPLPLLLDATCAALREGRGHHAGFAGAAAAAEGRDDAVSTVARLVWRSGEAGFAAVEDEYPAHLARWPDDWLARILLAEVVAWEDAEGRLAVLDELRGGERHLLPLWLQARRVTTLGRFDEALTRIDAGLRVDLPRVMGP